MSKNTARPFLKWAGGKTQLINELLKRTPSSFDTYYEPFVGGGAFFFALFREEKIKKACLADLNEELIHTYIAVRDNVDDVIKILHKYNRKHSESEFYKIRELEPACLSLPEKAARMIYLNKTCYNGLYRVNRQGKFNVPFGRYKTPKICDEENLRAVAKALKDVKIERTSFENVLQKAKKGDLVYFDPPYEPISKTANFTSYHQDGFTQDSQRKLREVCHQLDKRDVKFILSNSYSDFISKLYSTNGFFVDGVEAIRAINSNPKRRGKLVELIVTNYPTHTI